MVAVDLLKDTKESVINEFHLHPKDTGSAYVQIAILSQRIEKLMEHFKTHKKDHSSRRGLLQLISSRRKLLDYLSKNDAPKYKEVLEKLNLRK
ncbi:30S ribosomal protein S15 [bacterium Unc6]|nr:30S ribosomal protein S15 [bacterium Unc6]